MTYKQIVDSVKEAVDRHQILMDFGYGALTDIKTVDEGETPNVDYPYLFLNPTPSTRTGQAVTYRFNMIVMDVVQDDPNNKYHNYLKKQSECQQYVDDVLGYLRFKSPLSKFDLTLNMTLTPFKERFQDTLAGMTATLEIVVPATLNFCEAPYYEFLFEGAMTYDTSIEPDPNGRALGYTSVEDPYNLYYYCKYASVKLGPGTYRVEIEAQSAITEPTKPAPPIPRLRPHRIDTSDCSAPAIATSTVLPAHSEGWPVGLTDDQTFTWKATYYWNTDEMGPPLVGDLIDSMQITLMQENNVDESMVNIYGGTIKMYGV